MGHVTARGRRIAVRVAALFAVSWIVLTPASASAECAALDTSCVADTVEETSGDAVETVEDATGTVDETVDETVEQAEEVVDDVEETVNETADEVMDTVNDTGKDTVDETVDDTVRTVEDTIDPVVPVAPGDPEPGSDDPSGRGSRPEIDSSVARPGAGEDPSPALELDLLAGTASTTAIAPAATVTATSPVDPFGPFAGSLPEVARRLAFPLALIALVLGFVAIQNRLDRKDPKLALAATTPDVLSFT